MYLSHEHFFIFYLTRRSWDYGTRISKKFRRVNRLRGPTESGSDFMPAIHRVFR